jgi:hypothetical protein
MKPIKTVTIISFLLLLVFLFGCAGSRPSADEIAKADCGIFPDNYVEIVKAWIFDNFL